jgi:hypothetical protein
MIGASGRSLTSASSLNGSPCYDPRRHEHYAAARVLGSSDRPRRCVDVAQRWKAAMLDRGWGDIASP